MSYILDALRKADAQRERDPARGIHAQPLQGAVDSHGGASMRRKALWAAAAVGLAAIAGAAWYLARPGAPDRRPAPQVDATASRTMAQQPPPAAQVLPPPVLVAKVPVIAAPSIVPVQATVQAPAQMPAPPAREVSRAEPAPLVTAPTAAGQPPGMTPFHGPQGAGMAPAPANMPARAAAPIPPSPPLPPVHGLPADAPKLVINGGVYSADPAQRMLIVNGQVVKEGADLGSGVKLEQITAKSAVLGFRGARYTVGY